MTKEKKKNHLIRYILLAMLLGIGIGFAINLRLSQQKPEPAQWVDRSQSKMVQEQVTIHLNSYSESVFRQAKKDAAAPFAVMSDIFLHLIKMIIAPLVLAVLVLGVAKLGDIKSVGRIGLKTLLYFTAATLIALAIGLALVNIFEPGKVMQLQPPDAAQISPVGQSKQSASNFIDHLIPESLVRSMAANDILPIVVFSIFFGLAAASIGKAADPLVKAFDSLSQVMFKVTHFVMNFAPLGVFGAICSVVIQQGLDVLSGYLYLIFCFFLGLVFFIVVVLGFICYLFRIRFLQLLKDIREPALLAFSTSSSESAMPKTIEALEQHGISNRIVSFVLPMGYSFNLDGSIMYMTFATLFIAQCYGIHMGAAEQVQMMLVLLVTSKGMAGVPRASLVVIAGMLSMFHIPGEGLLLLLAVDQILDMGRSATNVVGNAVASAVVARWEGEKF